MGEDMAKQKMTAKDKAEWEELYFYVKNIMNYDENQSLSRDMVLRLKGLSNNKFMANNHTESTANYSYGTILNTFKFCSTDIRNALKSSNFNNEMHKFNLILKIVERNINNVYTRMKNVEKAKEEAKNTTVEVFNHEGATYKPKEKKKDKFSDLW